MFFSASSLAVSRLIVVKMMPHHVDCGTKSVKFVTCVAGNPLNYVVLWYEADSIKRTSISLAIVGTVSKVQDWMCPSDVLLQYG